MPPDLEPTNPANGDLPMTEQMTGRKEPAGTERPAGSGPSGPPSPRDLAARAPHHQASRVADSARPEGGSLPAGVPAAPAQAAPVPEPMPGSGAAPAPGVPAQGEP